MREPDLRTVLLVKALEEADREGVVIPHADRTAALRDAARAAKSPDDMESVLVPRAHALFARLAPRFPFLETLRKALGSFHLVTLGLVLLAFAAGLGLSALDGSRRINILALPLPGILAWNLAVYVLLLVLAVRKKGTVETPLRGWLAGAVGRVASRLVQRSRAFNAPLASALEAFMREWLAATRPLLLARAALAFHLAAAALAAGLVAGLYSRGIAFEYRAGWESTFLDAANVRGLLLLLYGPASALTQIPIPDVAALEAIRWREAGGGESGARWIHLMAATLAIYVVIPRLALAFAAWATALARSLRSPVPDSLAAYFRERLRAAEGATPARVVILPYATELTPGAVASLIAWLPQSLGRPARVEARSSIPYGEEDRYLAAWDEAGGSSADIVVLPFSLAATPEDENHGKVIAAARDRIAARPRAELLVLVDEAPFAARMGAERVAERRELWKRFVEARGLEPRFASLAP